MAEPSKVASLNPDNMVGGGLKDDFDGEVIKARFCPWDYNGKLDHHVLAVRVEIKADDEDEPIIAFYSAGDLEAFVPSMDGETGVDLANGEGEALDGLYALRVGKKEALSSSTKFAELLQKMIDANFPKDKMSAAVSFLEGTYGHWNRIPAKKRSGLVKAAPAAGQQARADEIMVLTEFKEYRVKGAAAGKPAGGIKTSASPKSAPATSAPATTAPVTGGDLDSKLVDIVRAGLKAAGDDGLTKAALPGLALKGLPPADKGKGVKRVVDAAFLGAHEDVWVYDGDSGTLFSAEG